MNVAVWTGLHHRIKVALKSLDTFLSEKRQAIKIDNSLFIVSQVTSERWVRLNTKLHEFHNYLARRMVEGNRYQIRVTAVNDCGAGEASGLSESFMPLAPTSEVTQLKTGKLTGSWYG